MSVMNEKKFKFIDKTNKKHTGIFCSVCNFLLKTADDDLLSKKYDCCHDCYLRYVEARKNEWISGWRPDKSVVIDTYKEKSQLFIK